MVHHPAMKAYSVDLKEKIAAAVGRGMSKAQAARTFLLAWGATRMIFIRRGTGRELSAIVLVLRTSCVLRTSWS